MKTRSFASFLTRLIWLCMAPLLLLAVWLAWDSLQEREARHRREGEELAQNFAVAIDQHLRARINALNMLAVSPLADDPRRWPALYAEAQGFRQSFGIHVIFADTDRQMRFNTRQPYGTRLPRLPVSKGQSAAPLALATGRPQVGDIVIGPLAKVPLVAIAVPVMRDGRPTGLMLCIFEAEKLRQRLDQVALPEGWSIALQDGTGADIARRSPPGFDPARDVADDHRFSVHSRLSPWSVVLEIPRSSHWVSYYRALAVLVAGIVLATLLGLLGGTLAGRRLGRQIQALSVPDATGTAPEIAEIAVARRALDDAAAGERASAARFERLFRDAPVPLCFVSQSGVLADRNRRFDQAFGYSHDELRSLDDWWPRAYPDPAYRDWALATWNAAVAEAARSGTDIAPIKYTVTCKDGSRRDMLISGITLGQDVLATFFDVTERGQTEQIQAALLAEQKQARLAALNQMEDANAARLEVEAAYASLRASQVQLRATVDTALDGIVVIDDAGHVVEFNPAAERTFGYRRDAVLGRELAPIIIPERFRAHHALGLARLRAGRDEASILGHRVEVTALRADGSEFPAELAIEKAQLQSGTLYVAYLRDISERQRARQEIMDLNASLEQRVVARTAELSAANRELDAFAYAVSHDLRAPLRAMNGFAQALAEDYAAQLDSEAKTYLDHIGLASRRMGELIEGILTLSRSTRGEVRHDVVNLSALARRRLDERMREESGRVVATSVADDLVVRGDERMLEAALGNLVDNAWKYSANAEAPSIRVYGEEQHGQRWFCVADNGAGFDMAHAARLFQPFQRLHRQDEFPGIGIGLATVQRIIHRHGGEIEAFGEPGKGARFCFTLPETYGE